MERILIIGATSAIATAWAQRRAAGGASFILVARDREKLEQTAADLRVRGASHCTLVELDVMNFDQHTALFDAVKEGDAALDIALVAHGTLTDQARAQQDVDYALRELHLNGTSVIALLTRLANLFEQQGHGTLAVISSVAGDRGRPSNYLYGSAKAAVSTFCEGLRARLFKAGVQLVTIKPGFVDTPMTADLDLPALLLATPEQVAARIDKGIRRGTPVLYAPAFWACIMLVIRLIPQAIFKRLSL